MPSAIEVLDSGLECAISNAGLILGINEQYHGIFLVDLTSDGLVSSNRAVASDGYVAILAIAVPCETGQSTLIQVSLVYVGVAISVAVGIQSILNNSALCVSRTSGLLNLQSGCLGAVPNVVLNVLVVVSILSVVLNTEDVSVGLVQRKTDSCWCLQMQP